MTLPIDSVYILALSGWRTETRGSGWHYARRWAERAPVVIVQPELPGGAPPGWETDPRLANVEILSIREQVAYPSFSVGLIQAEQILGAMRRRDHRRPLLWLYNPCLLFAYALAPAAGRIYHAVENYFEWKTGSGYWEIDADFIDMARAAIAISDKVLCFSGPTVERFRAETGRRDLELLPIGCDYSFYADPRPAAGAWVEELRPLLAAGTPIAVCAGNINLKLDFPLLHRLADELADVHFVYDGPVAWDHLDPADRASWEALLRRRNVSYIGRSDVGDLPWLYRLADRGFIPYRRLGFFVNSAFPLKALEMAAAGLPVVASLMQPLLAAPDAVAVAQDDDGFVEKLKAASRRTRSPQAAARADALCRAHDYDRLFERVLDIVRGAGLDASPRPASLAPVYQGIGLDRAVADLGRIDEYAAEIARLNAVYPGEISRLRGELDRIEKVYAAEIRRLNDVYSTEISRLNDAISHPIRPLLRLLRRKAGALARNFRKGPASARGHSPAPNRPPGP